VSDEFIGLVVAEDSPNTIESARSGGVDAGEVAHASECAAGESAEERRSDVGSLGPGEGAEGPDQPSGDLWSGTLVAPDKDGFMEQFERARVVTKADSETTGERHNAARSKGSDCRTCGRGRCNAPPRRALRRDRRYRWGEGANMDP
jgi:hypothetical protein